MPVPNFYILKPAIKHGMKLAYYSPSSDTIGMPEPEQFHTDDGYPSQDFYADIEKELEARKFPGVETSRQEFAEDGLLSEQRIYLRLMRDKLAIVAPFGVYFFACCAFLCLRRQGWRRRSRPNHWRREI